MEEIRLLSENVQMYAASGEEKPFVCVAFGGIAKGLGTPVFEFMRTLSVAGVSSLFVKDPSQGWYQRPIEGLGDTPEEMANSLSELLRKNFPGKRVVAVGNSMGGFAAIVFGCLSKLDRVIAFSPQTFIDPQLRQKHRDTRWQTEIGKIPRIYLSDLKSMVSINSVEIDIYAGEKTPLDVAHARHLDGLRNVRIHLLTECGHIRGNCEPWRSMKPRDAYTSVGEVKRNVPVHIRSDREPLSPAVPVLWLLPGHRTPRLRP